MSRTKFLFPVAALVALFVALNTAQAASISSTFDSSAEGWTTPIGNLYHEPADGNPGGFIWLEDANTYELDLVAVAPAAFHGNLLSFNGGSLSFDSRVFVAGVFALPSFGYVTISNGIDTVIVDIAADDPVGVWTTYSAPLTSSYWGVSEPLWQSILGNVTHIEVLLESFLTAEAMDFDNFIISTDPAEVVVPEPSTWAMLAVGLMALVVAPLRSRAKAARLAG